MNINSGVSQGAPALQRHPHPGNILGLLHVPLMFIIFHGLLLGNVPTENGEWMRARCGWSYRSRLMEKSWPHRHRAWARPPSAPPPPPCAAPTGLWPQSAHPQEWLQQCLPPSGPEEGLGLWI